MGTSKLSLRLVPSSTSLSSSDPPLYPPDSVAFGPSLRVLFLFYFISLFYSLLELGALLSWTTR
jgi:hypothetical protein